MECDGVFAAFDKDGPLSAEEEEQLALAKHKMLGNIKFIGKHIKFQCEARYLTRK